MSYIGFESQQGRVEIGGHERAWMGCLIDDLAWTMYRAHHPAPATNGPMDDYREKSRWRWSSEDRENGFAERLGYVCLMGNDYLILIAHIHGQCEVNGWVHPDDLPWFADLLEGALDTGLLRDMERPNYDGWRKVVELARNSTTPLVMDYSVTDGWPDVYAIANETDLFPAGRTEDDYDGSAYDKAWMVWEEVADDEKERILTEALPLLRPRIAPDEHWLSWSWYVLPKEGS